MLHTHEMGRCRQAMPQINARETSEVYRSQNYPRLWSFLFSRLCYSKENAISVWSVLSVVDLGIPQDFPHHLSPGPCCVAYALWKCGHALGKRVRHGEYLRSVLHCLLLYKTTGRTYKQQQGRTDLPGGSLSGWSLFPQKWWSSGFTPFLNCLWPSCYILSSVSVILYDNSRIYLVHL